MDTLNMLGTALGLTLLAGVNLYLTVFVTGLSINLGWVQLSPGLEGLRVLGDPLILIVAGVLLAVELVADKCPYVDSAWDAVHTVIRPIGGAFLALKALGTVDPTLEIVAILLGGSVAFTAHAAKAGSRVLINTSPEPVSNVAASVTENVGVLGGLWLAFAHPVITLILVAAFVIGFWYVAPRFFRMIKMNVIGLIHRFRARRAPAAGSTPLPATLPPFAIDRWLDRQHPGEEIAWVLPGFTGRFKPLGRHVRGCLVGTTAGRLLFISRKNWRVRDHELAVDHLVVRDDPGAVFHRLSLKTKDGALYAVRFTRRFSPHVPAVTRWLADRRTPAPAPADVTNAGIPVTLSR